MFALIWARSGGAHIQLSNSRATRIMAGNQQPKLLARVILPICAGILSTSCSRLESRSFY
jgi:hypothetical protein